jgi:hypothetical protein
MSILSGIFTGGGNKKFKPLPVDDPYTAQYLQGIDASGKGQLNQINTTFGPGNGQAGTWLNTQNARDYSHGWGNSSLAGSYSLGNEQRRQQALLDLDNQLFAQRLQAKQAGTSAALQQFGINTGAKTAFQNRQAQAQQNSTDAFAGLLGAGLKAGSTAGFSTSAIGQGLTAAAPFMGFA